MNEIGASLTTAGLIATIVSVLLAVAALYVSHRRRTLSGGHTVVRSPSPSTPDMSPKTAHKPDRVHVPLAATAEPVNAEPRTASPKPGLVMANTMRTPRSTTVHQATPPHPPNVSGTDHGGELYEWE